MIQNIAGHENPLVTVVLLNWNGQRLLAQFLPALLRTTYSPIEIVVADNGSTDNSIHFLESEYPQVRILKWSENLGFTVGNNSALPYISSPYFVLLNTDVEVTPGWLDGMVKIMQGFPEVAAIQPKILSWGEPDKFEYAGAAGGFLDYLAFPFCRGRVFQHLETDVGQYDETCEIAWASGACILLRKSVVEEHGLFEPSFFAHMEEIDLCWRLRNHGYKILCFPFSVVYHVGGGTLSKENPKKTYLNFRNSLMTLLLNLPTHQLIPKIFIRMILDAVYTAKEVLNGKFYLISLMFNAHIHFYQHVPYLLKQRKKYYPNGVPKKLPNTGILNKLMIVQHFILGVNSFKEVAGLINYQIKKNK
jgi:GT2 family glycosyltransferase